MKCALRWRQTSLSGIFRPYWQQGISNPLIVHRFYLYLTRSQDEEMSKFFLPPFRWSEPSTEVVYSEIAPKPYIQSSNMVNNHPNNNHKLELYIVERTNIVKICFLKKIGVTANPWTSGEKEHQADSADFRNSSERGCLSRALVDIGIVLFFCLSIFAPGQRPGKNGENMASSSRTPLNIPEYSPCPVPTETSFDRSPQPASSIREPKTLIFQLSTIT